MLSAWSIQTIGHQLPIMHDRVISQCVGLIHVAIKFPMTSVLSVQNLSIRHLYKNATNGRKL